MEFKEKLYALRSHMKLSQEELAQKLDISRQSVTKWENGQTFPDIQNLIQLSNIFKVTIDRLVKENDACNIPIIPQEVYMESEIRMFLLRAKKNTYISGCRTESSKPRSTDYRYMEHDYTYVDTYIGNEQFAGEETVWIKEAPVYAMNYYGQIYDNSFEVQFLKDALLLASLEKPYRGPELYQKGDYSYHCEINGDFDCFHGEEKIYYKQDKIYRCMIHGGSIL